MCHIDSTAISVPDVPACENPSDIGSDHESDDNASGDLSAECELIEETELHVMDMRSDAAQAITLTPAQLELFETR